MRLPTFVVPILSLLVCLTRLHAQATSKIEPDRVVGQVYGKAITAAEVGLSAPIDPDVRFDSRDTAQCDRTERISTVFGEPILERFVKERKIDATADEIQRFQANSRIWNKDLLHEMEIELASVEKKLQAPGLPEFTRKELEERRETLEITLPGLRKSARDGDPADIARMFILSWKIERELHRVYGGRVIFQQFGLEALDGRRRLFEEAEKTGDLKFDDADVKHVFYYYYTNVRHSEVDDDALEHPWFFQKFEKPAPEK